MWWYNFGIHTYTAAIRMAAPFSAKAKLWTQGRKQILQRLRECVHGEKIIWVHAASLGEFEQGRPVIEALRERCPEYKILLTFFSPSGYEIRRNYNGADWVFYLPADTARNAAEFLDIVRPAAAVFIKYEFWLNYLNELAVRGVPTYLISAIFRRDAVFFKPYGKAFLSALATFRTIFVQDQPSRQLLEEFGVGQTVVAGDTRFDRVTTIVRNAVELPLVEDFAAGRPVFVAGSTWGPDEQILAELINQTEGMKFIIVPHEIDNNRIEKFAAAVTGGCQRYTSYEQGRDAKVLVIDTIGVLSSVYRYGRYAYIGGGFGVGIHNTLEAAVYGIPVVFGPNYKKFKEAVDLIAAGGAASISDCTGLTAWFRRLESDDSAWQSAASAAGNYVATHTGATETILKTLTDTLC